MAVLFFLFGLIAVASTASLSQCPSHLPRDGYLTAFGNNCFRFHLSELKEYTNARSKCKNEGGTLALVKTAYIQNHIANQLDYTYFYSGLVWIGLNDRDKEGVFRWEDGSKIGSHDYERWASGQGPDHSFIFPEFENCVVIDPIDNFKWHDYHCSDTFLLPNSNAFICQFDAVSTTVTPPPTIEAQTTEAQTTEAQTTDAQTTDAHTTDAQTTDAQTTDTQPTEAQTTKAQTPNAQTTTAQTTTAQTTTAQTTKAQTTEAQTTKAQTTTAQTTTAQTTTAQTTEAQTTTAQTTKAQTTKAQTTTAQTTTAQTTEAQTTEAQTTTAQTTTAPTTTAQTTTAPTTTAQTTTAQTAEAQTTKAHTTTAQPTEPSTTTLSTTQPQGGGCPPFSCELDCGMAGFATNPISNCPLCQCNE